MEKVTQPPWNPQMVEGFADLIEMKMKAKGDPPFSEFTFRMYFDKETSYKGYTGHLYKATLEELISRQIVVRDE